MPEAGEAIFTEADLEAAPTVGGFRAAGIDDEDLLEVTRVLGHSLSQIVAALRSMFAAVVLRRGRLGVRRGDPLGGSGEGAQPHARRRRPVPAACAAGGAAAARVFDLAGLGTGSTQISVAFADLAGFTRLGEQVATDQLGSVAGRLTALATDTAQPPVRLVKMIGDAAMLVSADPRALLEPS